MDVTGTNCSAPSEEYQFYLFPTVSIIALVIGLPGNLAAFFFFSFKVTPRTAFSVYISNLALADVLILCTLPFRIHYHMNRNSWVFGDVACRVTGIVFYANVYMSICFMTCICVDRYMATVHPHVYLRIRMSWYSLVVSVILWGVVGIAMLVFILMGPLEAQESGSCKCFENFSKKEWETRLGAFSVLSLIFGSLLPSVIILVCYPLAARRISRIKTKTAQKALKVIYAILVITLLCFLPNHVVYLVMTLNVSGNAFWAVCPSRVTIAHKQMGSGYGSDRQQNQPIKMEDTKQHVGPLDGNMSTKNPKSEQLCQVV
uniref:G-protein coupled receptors family 1 profile domain-containing protein n=1 Tax=Sphaeramia orbicularis TaxID=375764 RepID=A0A673BZJ0_9TELE